MSYSEKKINDSHFCEKKKATAKLVLLTTVFKVVVQLYVHAFLHVPPV